MANMVNFGGSLQPYRGPEGISQARNSARKYNRQRDSQLAGVGGYSPAILGNYMQMGQQQYQPSQYMGKAANSLADPQQYANRASIDASSVYENALGSAKREAARYGKKLSAADIRKAAIAGAAAKAGAINRARMMANDQRYRQLAQLAGLDTSAKNQYDNRRLAALRGAARVSGHADRMGLMKAGMYDKYSGEAAKYWGQGNVRGDDNGMPLNPQDYPRRNLAGGYNQQAAAGLGGYGGSNNNNTGKQSQGLSLPQIGLGAAAANAVRNSGNGRSFESSMNRDNDPLLNSVNSGFNRFDSKMGNIPGQYRTTQDGQRAINKRPALGSGYGKQTPAIDNDRSPLLNGSTVSGDGGAINPGVQGKETWLPQYNEFEIDGEYGNVRASLSDNEWFNKTMDNIDYDYMGRNTADDSEYDFVV